MATDAIQLVGTAPSGVKLYYFDPATGYVFDAVAGAYGAWSDGSYANYGVAATQQGTANRWVATRPAGVTVPFTIVARKVVDNSIANDTPVGSGAQLVPDVPPGQPGGLPTAVPDNAVKAYIAGGTLSSAVQVGGYVAGQDPSYYVMDVGGVPLKTDGFGRPIVASVLGPVGSILGITFPPGFVSATAEFIAAATWDSTVVPEASRRIGNPSRFVSPVQS